MNQRYRLPPVTTDEAGEERRAGFEFEFGNLPIAAASRALCDALGGSLEAISPFEAIIHDSALGRLKVERDADILKSVRYRKWLEGLGIAFTPGALGHDIESNIDRASRLLVPCEVVTGPLPLAELDRLDTLVAALDDIGAEGTQDSLVYAFGLHINASIPSGDAEVLRRYIQAFLLLYDWIVELGHTDRTRRYLTPYIDAFPSDYLELVLTPRYQPDLATLIDDYLHYNPTRNRALDMLPVFAHLDPQRVARKLTGSERKLVRGRPAFHYRLPDCKINSPGWSVASPWNHWVYVEQLAADASLLRELTNTWLFHRSEFSLSPHNRWIAVLTDYLSQKYFGG